MNNHRAASINDLPYSFSHLDELMGAAGLDVLIVTSKHNVQYLVGGYKFFFFAAMDAIGHSRYLPVFVYVRGRADDIAYIGNKMESFEHEVLPFWMPNFHPAAWGSVDSLGIAVDHLKANGLKDARIGVEPGFLPMDSFTTLSGALPDASILDATTVLENLRAIKTPAELDLLRKASEAITDAMQATVSASGAGDDKFTIIERQRREETNRGLHFDYCLLTLGASHNRTASDQTWQQGEVLSIDSGGNLHGYIGDICRMGVLGEPDAELQDLLAEIETVQQAAFANVRPGMLGGEMIAQAEAVRAAQDNAACSDFFAHGMGLISHEAPFLMTNHPVAYEGVDAANPLRQGMVLSVETTMLHPTRGYLKLEDTLAVTATGYEMFGTEGRGWNIGGGLA